MKQSGQNQPISDAACRRLAIDFFRREPDIPIFANRVRVDRPFPYHDHSFTELAIILEGEGQHRIGGDVYDVQVGDVYALDRDPPHGFSNPRNLVVGNVMFDRERLEFPEEELRGIPGYRSFLELEPKTRRQHEFKSRLRLSPRELRSVASLHRDLVEEIAEAEPGYGFLARQILLHFIGRLSRFYSQMQKCRPRGLNSVSRVLTYMETNLSEPLALETLADVGCMSTRSLLRAFREATDSSPIEYLTHLRLELACELLRNTDAPVTSIAYRVGMNSPEYFCRRFRHKHHTTPLRYRCQSRVRNGPSPVLGGRNGRQLPPQCRTEA